MIKLKHFLVIGIVSIFIYACGSDSSESNFDHAGQATKDNEAIINFLKNNYFDTTVDSIKPLIDGKKSLYAETDKLKKQEITENDINYILYYYVEREGTPVPDKGFPTVADSVYVKYKGQRIVNKDSLSVSFDKGGPLWLTLASTLVNGSVKAGTIKGWSYGFTHFKGGKNITTNGPITYEGGGKGILFIPSGLAYRNSKAGAIPENSNLIFYIELWDHIKDTDGDNDNVASIVEDLDGDGNLNNDDTDKDNIPNYLDTDDDGDGKLTKDEDTNGDGDPTNDFSDPSKPTVPDYLNRNIF